MNIVKKIFLPTLFYFVFCGGAFASNIKQLDVSVVNNNLYIDSCYSQLLSFMGYKGYANGIEIFTTGPGGGFPCYSGNLFISDLSQFLSKYILSPFYFSFDFYSSIDFVPPVFANFNLYYDGTNFTVFDNSTHTISFDVSTSTKTTTVHNYISQNDVDTGINFNISTSTQGDIYTSETIYPTTTGDFYYTWNYPEFTTEGDYIFYTDITKNSNILSSTSTIISILPPSPTVTGYSNVLFLPGLEASRLYEDRGVTCDINCEDQLWEPNISSDVSELYMDQNGISLKSGIYTRDIIDKSIIFNIYESLIKKLDQLVTVTSPNKIKEWKAYAYDWRKNVDNIVQNGTEYEDGQMVSLVGTLQYLANSSNTGKVTIIAHSNGGLLAKILIKKLEDMKSTGQGNLIDKIDNLILIASPQMGTPEGLLSAYGLLPSRKYFEQQGIIYPATFTSTANQQYINMYGVDINTYDEQKDFILGTEGRFTPAVNDLISPIIGNSLLLEQSENLHNIIDNMTIPSSIKVIEIAGWGKATIAGMTYTGNDLEPIYTYNGDKTVVSQSALYGQGDKYWLDLSRSKLEHKNITEDPDLLTFIQSIIENNSVTTKIQNTQPIQNTTRLHLSVHSPITIGVTDISGNFTGKVCDTNGDCYIQEDIPGSTYNEFGEGKYVTLAENDLQKVTMQGTDIGTFTFNFEKVMPDGTTQMQTFQDIPVTPQTKAEVIVNQSTHIPQITLDLTSDGITDFTIQPKADFDPILFLQILRKTIESFDANKGQKEKLYGRIDDTIKAIQKGKINKAKLKIEQFRKILAIHPKEKEKEKNESKKLTITDTQLLITMLNQLLDNLNK
ncbi:MAG: alpha/beta hydrolase [Candidatus Zambryskibacteria bacterium]|nr:alpha/beta hydrolase [Candidatus Zambryskibacteria bacterium]